MFRLTCLVLMVVAVSAQTADQRVGEFRENPARVLATTVNGRARFNEPIIMRGTNGNAPTLGGSNAFVVNDIILSSEGLMPGSGGLMSGLNLGGLDMRLLAGGAGVSGGQFRSVGGAGAGAGAFGGLIRVDGGNVGRIQRGGTQQGVLRNGRVVQLPAGFARQRAIQANGAVSARLNGVAGTQPRALTRAAAGGVVQRAPGTLIPQMLSAGNGRLPRRIRAQGAIAQGNTGILNGLNGLNGMGLNGLNGINGLVEVNGLNGLNGLIGINGLNGLNRLNGRNGINGLASLNGLMRGGIVI